MRQYPIACYLKRYTLWNKQSWVFFTHVLIQQPPLLDTMKTTGGDILLPSSMDYTSSTTHCLKVELKLRNVSSEIQGKL